MRYKNFTFPHEPEKLEIGLRSRLGVGHCPGYGPVIQELGVQQRVITGEGSFFGEKAGEQSFCRGTAPLLPILPAWGGWARGMGRCFGTALSFWSGWGEVIMCFSPARRGGEWRLRL